MGENKGKPRKKLTYVASDDGLQQAEVALAKYFGSKQELAFASNLSRSTIQKFFRQSPISYDSFVQICEALELSDWKIIAGLNVQEEQIKINNNSSEESSDALHNLTLDLDVLEKYANDYKKNNGFLKVLEMRREGSLDDIYINVNFKGDTLACYSTINDIEKLFRQRNYQDYNRISALKVANQQPLLMVLGHPGSGKTTLLRKIGLEALKAVQGEYEHKCIPVLLELRRFKKEEEIDLVKAIAHEFKICGLPEFEQITENLLEKGKLLILSY